MRENRRGEVLQELRWQKMEVFRTTAVSYSSITPPLAEISGFATLRPQMQEQAIVEWLDSN